MSLQFSTVMVYAFRPASITKGRERDHDPVSGITIDYVREQVRTELIRQLPAEQRDLIDAQIAYAIETNKLHGGAVPLVLVVGGLSKKAGSQ